MRGKTRLVVADNNPDTGWRGDGVDSLSILIPELGEGADVQTAIEQGVDVLREEGTRSLAEKIPRRLYEEFLTARGHYSATVGDVEVTFSAPTATMVRRNRARIESERAIIEDILQELDSGDVFFDVGANTGLYSLFVGEARPGGEVVAFEPYAPNVALFEQDIARNRLTNVEVREVALSDEDGTVAFGQPRDIDLGYGSSAIQGNQTERTVEVPAATGDGLVSSGAVPHPNVVKIDVEGAEPLVVDGLSETLSAPECRLLYCEIHLPRGTNHPSIADFGTTREEFEARLQEFGFNTAAIQTREEKQVFIKASKEDRRRIDAPGVCAR